MHRRVAQTVAALPHRASQRPWDPDSDVEIATQQTADILGPDVAGQRPALDNNYNVDSHTYPRFLQMSSSNDSIASGGEHPRLSSSPVSMHPDSPTSTMPQEDAVDTTLLLQPENDDHLEDERDEIEWELQNNGLYVGAFLIL